MCNPWMPCSGYYGGRASDFIRRYSLHDGPLLSLDSGPRSDTQKKDFVPENPLQATWLQGQEPLGLGKVVDQLIYLCRLIYLSSIS